jgi:hypothetical protein
MIFINFCVLVVRVERLAINAFIIRRMSCTFFQPVASCAERTCFRSSAFPKSVIKSGEFKAPVSHKVILNAAD